MKNRKPGELLEIFGDFWLGIAGAAAKGFSEFSATRREDKGSEHDTPDFFTRASEALEAAAVEAQKVAASTRRELAERELPQAD